MRSRIVQQQQNERFERMTQRADGRLPEILSFSSDTAAAIGIAELSKIPLLENTTDLQDASGNFYFLFGYSAIDGPDIMG